MHPVFSWGSCCKSVYHGVAVPFCAYCCAVWGSYVRARVRVTAKSRIMISFPNITVETKIFYDWANIFDTTSEGIHHCVNLPFFPFFCPIPLRFILGDWGNATERAGISLYANVRGYEHPCGKALHGDPLLPPKCHMLHLKHCSIPPKHHPLSLNESWRSDGRLTPVSSLVSRMCQ